MVGQRMKTNNDTTNPSERGLALSRREIWITLLLYPGHTLPTAAAPVVVAVGLALRDHVFAALPTVLAFLGSWLIHIAGVLTDNLELLRRHPAVSEHPELQDAIERHTLTLRGLEMAIVACVVAAVLAGLYLVLLGGDLVLALGIVGLVAGLAYAGGPLPYARSGMAEPIFFIMFGIVAEAGTYYIQTAATHGAPSGWVSSLRMVPWDVFVAGLPIGALITNVLIIDDIRDHAFDAAKGWRTGTVRFGVGWSRVRYLVLTAGALSGADLLLVRARIQRVDPAAPAHFTFSVDDRPHGLHARTHSGFGGDDTARVAAVAQFRGAPCDRSRGRRTLTGHIASAYARQRIILEIVEHAPAAKRGFKHGLRHSIGHFTDQCGLRRNAA